MPSNLADRFVPILDAIRIVQDMLADKRFEDFRKDQILRLASERAIGIVSETSRRIPADAKRQQPDIDWPRLARLGKYLRKHYYEIEPRWLWEVAARDLPPLKAIAERIIRESQN